MRCTKIIYLHSPLRQVILHSRAFSRQEDFNQTDFKHQHMSHFQVHADSTHNYIATLF